MPKLSEIELTDKVIEDEEYKKELKHLQKKLGELHNRLYRKRVPVIITYEAGTQPEKEAILSGSQKPLIPVALRSIQSPARNLTKRRVITSGASGPDCPKTVTLPSSTAPGMAV